jgi:hypothetical protein
MGLLKQLMIFGELSSGKKPLFFKKTPVSYLQTYVHTFVDLLYTLGTFFIP